MKRVLFTSVVTLVASLNLSMSEGFRSELLSYQDIELAHSSNSGPPPLSSPPEASIYWESYNEWLCFPSEGLTIELFEHGLESATLIPTLIIPFEGHSYEFMVSSGVIGGNWFEVRDDWELLLESEGTFCVLAAFLQDLERQGKGSLWVLKTLKTPKGYWHEDDLN